MNALNTYLKDNLEMVEELTGTLTDNEKIELKNQFVNKFVQFALKYNYDVLFLLSDIDIIHTLSELLDYSEIQVVKYVNDIMDGVLHG